MDRVDKKIIRANALKKRRSLVEAYKKQASDIITNKLLETIAFKESKNILIYASYNNEVDTDVLVLQSLMRGKNVYMPKVFTECMEFYRVFSLDELIVGSFGIREPIELEHLRFDNNKESLCILPLVAFDIDCNRVGYGKGYYDRYLSKNRVDYTVAIAFECQRSDQLIDVDAYDRQLDYVITETAIYGHE